MFKLDGEKIPEELMYTLRIYHAEMADLQDFEKAREGKPISSFNEKKALEEIVKFCTESLRKYPTSRKEDKKILLKGKLTNNAKYAVILRRAEKRILQSLKKQATSRLQSLKQNWNERPTENLRWDSNLKKFTSKTGNERK